MPKRSLSETQVDFREAMTGAPLEALLARLRPPADPVLRLDIYRRHHLESFRRHLRGRYPTLEWLLGTGRLVELADATLRQLPPHAPSLAEYGRELVDVLLSDGLDLPPYIADVALLDWHLGCLSVAIDSHALRLDALAMVDPADLAQISLTLQPGLAYVASDWPVDELVHLRHQGNAPEQLAFQPRPTHLELKGSRGRFAIRRLEPGPFIFRSRLTTGASLASAAEQAMQAQPSFELPAAPASSRSARCLVRCRCRSSCSPSVAMGFVFFNAGILKLRSFEFAVKLFADEYHLPIIPPELAARLAMTVELVVPLFLFAGLATRLATLPLLAMTLVIVTLVYPASWVESLLWGSVLVMILTRGPGVISLDHLFDRWFQKH